MNISSLLSQQNILLSGHYFSNVPFSTLTAFIGMEEASESQSIHRLEPRPILHANLSIHIPLPTLLSQVGSGSRSMLGLFSRLVASHAGEIK